MCVCARARLRCGITGMTDGVPLHIAASLMAGLLVRFAGRFVRRCPTTCPTPCRTHPPTPPPPHPHTLLFTAHSTPAMEVQPRPPACEFRGFASLHSMFPLALPLPFTPSTRSPPP